MSRLICAAFVLLLSAGTLHAQNWQEYISRSNHFIVNFPGEPKITDISYTSELNAQIPARIYSVDNEAGKYSMTVVDYTQADRVHRALCEASSDYFCDGNEVQTEVRGAVAFAAWNIRKSTDGEITYDGYAQVDGVPGHQLQITHPDGSKTYVAIHIDARRLFILEGTVPDDAPPPGLFQQSLGILDDNGHRIRYRYDENDRPYRVETEDDWIGAEYAEYTNILD
jgi:YD repeat-containing protein